MGSLPAPLIRMPAAGARPAQSLALRLAHSAPRTARALGTASVQGNPRPRHLGPCWCPPQQDPPPSLSLVSSPERGSIPSYILTSLKEQDCARWKHAVCLSKLCRVLSLDHTYGGTPGTGSRGSRGLAAGPVCAAAIGTKPYCWSPVQASTTQYSPAWLLKPGPVPGDLKSSPRLRDAAATFPLAGVTCSEAEHASLVNAHAHPMHIRFGED